MRKLHIKAKFKIVLLIFVSITVIIIAGNVSLVVNKKAIDRRIANYFNHSITVGSIFFVFPNQIVVNNINIAKASSSENQSSFILPSVRMQFSIRDLLTSGGFSISNVTVRPSKISYYALSEFLEDNAGEILAIIRNSSGNDLNIRILETLLDFDRQGNPDYLALRVQMDITGDTIVGNGLFRADRYQFNQGREVMRRTSKGWPLKYKLVGQLKSNGLVVDQLILKSENIYSKLWGSIKNATLKINGFMFMDSTKQRISNAGKTKANYLEDLSLDQNMPNIDLFVLDIDNKMHFKYPEIEIEKFNFTLNNIPASLKGSFSLSDVPTLAGELTLYHPQNIDTDDAIYDKAHLKFTSAWKENRLKTNGQANIHFNKNTALSLSPDNAQVNFQNLEIQFDEFKRTFLYLESGDIVYRTSDNDHKFSLQDLEMSINSQVVGLKVLEFDAPFYGGLLNGKMWIDSIHLPSKLTSIIELKDVNTDAMDELLIHFAKFNGQMSSKMNFTNIPQMSLNGDLVVYDGRLTEFKFFNWVSDSFGLPSLKSIAFERASAQLSINNDHIQLFDIRLRTDDVRIGGYYNVDNQKLVTSKLTVALTKRFLSESSKLKSILSSFEVEEPFLNFDFQLSGNMDSMNFQWLQSEVKKKIQTRIPDFVERSIEKNIDHLIEQDSNE